MKQKLATYPVEIAEACEEKKTVYKACYERINIESDGLIHLHLFDKFRPVGRMTDGSVDLEKIDS
jgi:hypothetical protein